MILLIDNHDSFTYNLYQQIESLGAPVQVVKNDKITIKKIAKLKPKKIVISAGPKRPDDAGISLSIVKKFYKIIPILGVCLGHQCIGQVFGSKIIQAKKIVHGKTVPIHHTGQGIFKNMPADFKAARYNSLVINSVPSEFELTAWDNNNDIMAIQHSEYPVYGVQFHPESFMTKAGNILMKNFVKA